MFCIETERLILSPFKMEDAEEYFQIISDKDIRKYVPYSSALTLKTTKEHLETYVKGDFARDFYICIRLKDSNKIIGAIIAVEISLNVLDVSYFIGNEFRNKGYCSEAVAAFCDYEGVKKYELLLTIENENLYSLNVAHKFDARFVGNLHKSKIYRINQIS